MEILNINSKRGQLTIQWSDQDTLIHYAAMQAGCYHVDISNVNWYSPDRFVPLHQAHFKHWNQERWSQRENMEVFDIPDGAKIVDIGCGVSITDLLLYSYIPNSVFYLVDKDDEWPDNLHPATVSYTESHPHYNSWNPVLDAIETSKFNRERFNMLSPNDSLPEDTDLIMSSYSWCFHYPKETYWQKVRDSLKTGGKLFLDVRLLQDRNMIQEINEEFKSLPTLIPIPESPAYLDNPPTLIPGVVGYRCLWIKNS
jgi:SAM-dependent methyltransferase